MCFFRFSRYSSLFRYPRLTHCAAKLADLGGTAGKPFPQQQRYSRLSIFNAGLALLMVTALLQAPSSHAYEQGSIQQCQSYRDQIERYTDRRRQGGSASQMRNWLKKRNLYNTLYSKYNCKAHRRYLK